MRPGDVIAGRFEVERLAGSGGMGAVYRAHDKETRQTVALKLVSSMEAFRFVREASILADLTHPAVVRYVAHGVNDDGSLYLAMEWLEGEDLAACLERGRLRTSDTLVVARRVAEALTAAHAHGVIHRDIKPSNVYLPGGVMEQAKLLDFGVARVSDSGGRSVTRLGTTIGSPGYMAPEQARGASDLDGRADIFSLGCVLFECVTGREAFSGHDVMALLAKILFADAPRVSELRADVLPGLDDLIARMLAKDPDERPENAQALLAEIERLSDPVLGAQLATSSRARVLTDAEQRYVSVVFAPALPMEGGTSNRTLNEDDLGGGDAALAARVRPFDAKLERLADGTSVATLVAAGTAKDQAAQAARCALAIRALRPLAPVVLATGRAVVAGRLPVGEVIERAASLARTLRSGAGAVRGPGSVGIDEVTARLLGESFEVVSDALGWAVLSERGGPVSVSGQGRLMRFVGRDAELRAMDEAVATSAAARTAKAMLITAPAGAGKSRLLREWLSRPHDRARIVLLSRGDPMRAGSPFGMVSGLVREAMGIVASQSLFERQEKITDHVRAYLRAEDTQRVIEFLGELVGAPFADTWSDQLRAARRNPILMGDQMRRAWEDWLGALSARSPVVLVLEDLHWGDLPTVQFLDTALRVLRDAPLFVLALGRPEVREIFPSLWQARDAFGIELGPLPREASAQVAREMLPGAPPDAIARLVERAAGNPFFLEELIRAAADGEAHSLPETVLAMAQARVEKLTSDERRVLRAASVYGEAFWRGGLAALLGSDAGLGDHLSALAAREVIVRKAQSQIEGQDEYFFRHTVVREAVYGMLTDRDRIVAHALAGKWLEQAGEGDALTLAEHFERGAESTRAVGWYRRAAEQALEGNDLAAVKARAARGIACGATGEVLGSLYLLEAEAHSWRGEFKEAQTCARAARDNLPPAGPAWYAAIAELAKVSGRLGHTQRLIDIAEVLDAWEPQDDARNACAIAAATSAVALFYSGRFELAERLLHRAQALATSNATSRAWTGRAVATKAMVAGEPASYLVALEESARSFEEAGDLRNACYQRVSVGYAELGIGAYARAEGCLVEALQTADRLGLVSLAMSAKHNLGMALLRRGKLAEARSVESEALAFFAEQGDHRLEGASRVTLAMILAAAGELALAEREALQACVLLEPLPPLRALALATLANVRLAQDRPAEALQAARQAHGVAESLGQGEGEAVVRLAYVEALVACGDLEGAGAAVEVARRRLLLRAARISDSAWRASFLEAVPEHARTFELASRWLEADVAAATVATP